MAPDKTRTPEKESGWEVCRTIKTRPMARPYEQAGEYGGYLPIQNKSTLVRCKEMGIRL